ncbi:hypothetical protein C7974DRAFT_457738 [Boeremia exigua]|uniref:uncharacterized protein n=1 Tax=Boeremia exigua TaxID=749465 RepID=UPI001E8EA0BD|nr:uncharacterized protein C7974DRAFT_457738 [Boeremia exigua]KAH6619925.1 hypothetical protein C7974DRAFT_457738 [Boeremia exigua]
MNDEPKADVKRRRLLSASDEDIQASMDAKQLPYRRGWPELQPLPLTNVSNFLDKIFSPTQQIDILDKARTVFQAQRLSTDYLRLVFRVPEHVDIDGSVNLRPYLTLLWAADFLQDSQRLNRCIIQIRQSLLRVVEFQNIAIECLHLTCIHRPPTYGIVLSDGAVKAKASDMMDHVVEQLGAKGRPWLCVEVARRGLIPEYFKCPPTILITTPDASDSR